MIIHRGKAVNTTRKDANRNQFRALCQIKSHLCIAESKAVTTFGDFKHALLQAGATEALYLDMGPGWNHAWYRHTPDSTIVLHPKTHPLLHQLDHILPLTFPVPSAHATRERHAARSESRADNQNS